MKVPPSLPGVHHGVGAGAQREAGAQALAASVREAVNAGGRVCADGWWVGFWVDLDGFGVGLGRRLGDFEGD